ncbi:MAG: hypothetical protein CM15mP49_16580 [Actinomycetota bacterium]|nr:MAG: hypothetical protein CM15mP49_16580 [Actinomycetota bacterium]
MFHYFSFGGVGHIGGAIIGASISPAGYCHNPQEGQILNHSIRGSMIEIVFRSDGQSRIRPDQEEDKESAFFKRKKTDTINQSRN